MDPIVTPTLALIQVISGLMSNSAAQSSAAQNLSFQRQQAAEQQRQSQATRTDAYGNQQRYNPATNSWETVLTPMQKAITTAGEAEQLKSVTEDAKRNRDLRVRQEQNSLDAEQPFNKALQGYQYNTPASEGAVSDKLGTLMQQANQDRGKQTQADLVKQTARQGATGGRIDAIVKAIDDKIGSGSGDTVLRSTQAAHAQHAGDVQAHNQEYLPELQGLGQIINQGGGASQRFSDTPDKLSAIQGQQQTGMLGAIQSAMSATNNASNSLVRAEGKSMDLSPLIKALSAKTPEAERWDKAPAKVDYSTTPDYLADITYGRRDSNGFSF